MGTRRLIVIGLSIVVSGVFLWLALRNVDVGEVVTSIREANLWWIAASYVALTLGLWTRAVRWRGLVNDRVPMVQAFHIINITFLLNQLPLRAGEVARSLLATRSGVPFVTAATSIVVERLLDTLLVVLLLAYGLTQLPDAPAGVTQTAAAFGVLAVIGFVVLLLFARFQHIPHRILDIVQGILPILERLPLKALLDNVLEGLQPLTKPRQLIHAVVWTIISWSVSLLIFWTLAKSLGVRDVNEFALTLLGVTLASFSIAIPVSVSGIGPFQAAVLLAGEAVGLPNAQSVSLGFLFHFSAILGYAVLGTISLLATGVSLGEVLQSAQEDNESAPTAQE